MPGAEPVGETLFRDSQNGPGTVAQVCAEAEPTAIVATFANEAVVTTLANGRH